MALFLLFIASMLALAFIVNFLISGSELSKIEKKLFGIEDMQECEVVEYTSRKSQD